MKIFVSIIAPIRNEVKYIRQLVESLNKQDYGKENFEIIFVDGRSTDGTHTEIEKIQQQQNNVQVHTNPNKTVPYALNIAIKQAKGEIIIRIDAHSNYPNNYISELVTQLYALKAENVGGVFDTQPANDTPTAIAIAEALRNRIGVGNSYHRIGKENIAEVDTVPYGCFRKSLFDRIGLFDTALTRNQDDEFNARIVKNGGKIFILPSLKIKYYARDSIGKMSTMFYQYGLYKPLVNKKIGYITSVRQLAPVLFTIGLLIGLLLSLFSEKFALIYLFSLIFYATILLGTTINIMIKKPLYHFSYLFLLPMIFFSIHISYGIGYLHGLIYLHNSDFWKKNSGLNINR